MGAMIARGTYETDDLVLAAYPVAGEVCRLIDIRSTGNGRKLFQFSPSPSKEQLIRYSSGEAQVSARRFAETYATLKGTGYAMREFRRWLGDEVR